MDDLGSEWLRRLSNRWARLVAIGGCAVWVMVAAPAAAHEDVDAQIEALAAHIDAAPGSAELFLKRGELRRARSEWDAALADYDRAAQLDRDMAAVDLARGQALLQAGRLDAALAALDRFVARRPENVHGHVARARALAQLGRGQAAAAELTRAIALDAHPQPEYFLERARALAATGDEHLDTAVCGLDDGIARLGPLVTLELAAIDLELRRQHYDAALARLERIAAQSSRRETWMVRRGEILERAGRLDAAHAAFSAAAAAIEALPPRQARTRAMAQLLAQARAAAERLTSRKHAEPKPHEVSRR